MQFSFDLQPLLLFTTRHEISWERSRVECISLEPVSPGIKTLSSLLEFYQHLLMSHHCEKKLQDFHTAPYSIVHTVLGNMEKTIDCLCFRTVKDYANLFFQQTNRQE